MTLSIWRFAHLALAIISFLFLTMASITGVILAFDPISEKVQPYKAENLDEVSLADAIPVLKENFSEIFEVSVDHNDFVLLEGMDADGNDFKQYINPQTAEVLGDPIVKSEFIEWTTALHRSLFLKETGRFLVGIFSFFLLLIAISGTILIIKRQQGIRHFFAKINKDSFAQYFHVVSGRLLLIPIFILALTGTHLFMVRFDILPIPEVEEAEITPIENAEENQIEIKDFKVFQNIKLKDVAKIEFPFMEDPEEFFTIKMHDREMVIDQFTGEIVSETIYSKASVLEKLSLDLHTGRTNFIWAIIIGIASLNILFFIYSGFVITFKRSKTKIGKNKFNKNDAEIIVLVGSENGSTLGFANKIHQQLLADGQRSFLTQMNQYSLYPKAKHFIIFTSTFGLGDAPSNAKKFENLLVKNPQNQPVSFSVVGFGSKAYEDFCGYAVSIDEFLANQSWANRLMELKTVNDKSPDEFSVWAKEWSETNLISLASTPALYAEKIPKLKSIKVASVTEIKEDDQTFKITFTTTQKYKSGDLLAIYPNDDHRERLYSIGKVNNKLQLVVKRHEFGLGSNYLYNLKSDETIKVRIVENKLFHFPKKSKKVAFIANGTGIAPFLGMMDENKSKSETHLYAGFRHLNSTTKAYQTYADEQISKGQLTSFQFAFSREENSAYVMDLVRKDAKFFAELLKNGGKIMICGALAMQRDVENVLEEICQQHLNQSVEIFKSNQQILTDCY